MSEDFMKKLSAQIQAIKNRDLAELRQDFQAVLEQVEPSDKRIYQKVLAAWNQLCKPLHSCGYLEEYLAKVAAAQGNACPDMEPAALAIFVGDNGIVSEGVSQSGPEVTAQVLVNIAAGAASSAIWARALGVKLLAVDMGSKDLKAPVEGTISARIMPQGTRNFLVDTAMDERSALASLLCGAAVAETLSKAGYKLLCGGEMGIANTTTSTALICLLSASDPEELCGRGAGLSDAGLARKKAVISQGVAKYADLAQDPLAALAALGGLDIAALTGFYLAAAAQKRPVILDGLISYAAAYLASLLAPAVRDYFLPSHLPREKASQLVLHKLGMDAPLDLNLALGEGAGALLLLPLLRLAKTEFTEMPSFSEGEVEEYVDYLSGTPSC